MLIPTVPDLIRAAMRCPRAGSPVQIDGRDIGTITSSVVSPALWKPIALAYLHRDHVAPGTTVSVAGTQGVVTPLPFVAHSAGL